MKTPLEKNTVIEKRYQIMMQASTQKEGSITYYGQDLTTRQPVVVEEFFPEYAIRKEGDTVYFSQVPDADRAAFQEQFYWKKRFGVLPTVASAYEIVLANNTVYAVYEYIGGSSVKKLKERRRPFTYESVSRMVTMLLLTNREMLRFGLCQPEFQAENVNITKEGYVKIMEFHPVEDTSAPDRSIKSIADLGYFMITGKHLSAGQKGGSVPSGGNLSRLAKYLKTVYHLPYGAISVEQMLSHAKMNFDVDLTALEQSHEPSAPVAAQAPATPKKPQKKIPLWAIITASSVAVILVVVMLAVVTSNAAKKLDKADTTLQLYYYKEDPAEGGERTEFKTKEEEKDIELNLLQLFSQMDLLNRTYEYENIENAETVWLDIDGVSEGMEPVVTADDTVIEKQDTGYYKITVDDNTKVTVKNEYSAWIFKTSSTYNFSCSQKEYAKLVNISYTIGENTFNVSDFDKDIKSYPDIATIEHTIEEIVVNCDGSKQFNITLTVNGEEIPNNSKIPIVHEKQDTKLQITVNVKDSSSKFIDNEYQLQFTVQAKPEPTPAPQSTKTPIPTPKPTKTPTPSPNPTTTPSPKPSYSIVPISTPTTKPTEAPTEKPEPETETKRTPPPIGKDYWGHFSSSYMAQCAEAGFTVETRTDVSGGKNGYVSHVELNEDQNTVIVHLHTGQ